MVYTVLRSRVLQIVSEEVSMGAVQSRSVRIRMATVTGGTMEFHMPDLGSFLFRGVPLEGAEITVAIDSYMGFPTVFRLFDHSSRADLVDTAGLDHSRKGGRLLLSLDWFRRKMDSRGGRVVGLIPGILFILALITGQFLLFLGTFLAIATVAAITRLVQVTRLSGFLFGAIKVGRESRGVVPRSPIPGFEGCTYLAGRHRERADRVSATLLTDPILCPITRDSFFRGMDVFLAWVALPEGGNVPCFGCGRVTGVPTIGEAVELSGSWVEGRLELKRGRAPNRPIGDLFFEGP